MDGFPAQLPGGLGLRPLRDEDAEAMSKYANSLSISRWMRNTFPYPYEVEHAKRWIAISNDEANWPPRSIESVPCSDEVKARPPITSRYAITLDDSYIGGCGLVFGSDVNNRTAEVGYWLAEEHWGKGYLTTVIRALVAWAWQAWPYLYRIEAVVYAGNPASERVLAKCGFQAEGVQRAAVWKNGQLLDQHRWALLRGRE